MTNNGEIDLSAHINGGGTIDSSGIHGNDGALAAGMVTQAEPLESAPDIWDSLPDVLPPYR